MADGVVTKDEKDVLIARAKGLGVEEKLLDEMLAKQKQQIGSSSSLEIVEEYAEKKADYLNDNIYDWTNFMLKISGLNPEHPHLRKYRDDILDMVSHNAQRFQEIARSWEELYRTSDIQSDWEQHREHMEKCLELAKYLRGMHERLLCASKADFIQLCTQLSTPSEDSW